MLFQSLLSIFLNQKSAQLHILRINIYNCLQKEITQKYKENQYKIRKRSMVFSNIRENYRFMNNSPIDVITCLPFRVKKNGQPFLRISFMCELHGVYYYILIWAKNETLSLL